MIPSPAIRKVFQGVANRPQLFRMFDRHAQRANRWNGDAAPFYSGEWFEIGETEHAGERRWRNRLCLARALRPVRSVHPRICDPGDLGRPPVSGSTKLTAIAIPPWSSARARTSRSISPSR